jgi:hypothetical protein
MATAGSRLWTISRRRRSPLAINGRHGASPTNRRWACPCFRPGGAKSRSPAYIHLVDMEHDGERLTVWFGHMTVKIVGKGLESLAEGLRRQIVYYIQAFHVSDVEARGEPHWVESIKIEPPAEEGVLGKWAG